jgi:hypothetical protein
MYRDGLAATVNLAIALTASAQGSAVENQPPIARPAFARDSGPVVAIDEAHRNTHTYGNQLQGFVRLLQRDGFRVRPFTSAITPAALDGVNVLVIAQPGGWDGPAASLTESEITDLIGWVRAGGSLLLLLDHMPAPLNAQRLTSAFGVNNWHNGYAMVDVPDSLPASRIRFRQREFIPTDDPLVTLTGATGAQGVLTYQGADALLVRHPITEGRGPEEQVRGVMTLVGSAFQPPAGAAPILVLPDRAISLTPESPGGSDVRRGSPPRAPVGRWVQGAVQELGRGRVALFGEVGLFSGQWPVHAAASENYKFDLNVIRWLSRVF